MAHQHGSQESRDPVQLSIIQPNKIIKGALEQAVVAGQIQSVKLLLAAGVSVEEKNGGVLKSSNIRSLYSRES